MRAREPQPTHTIDASNRAEQIREIVGSIEVRVHCLAEQHDLRHSLGDDLSRLANDFVEATASLRTAGRRHNAGSASVIAPALNRNPRLDAIEAARPEVLVVFLE